MSSFATYLIGFLILIGGLALAAYLLNVPPMWIGVGVIVLIGLGVLSATRRTKMRDPAEARRRGAAGHRRRRRTRRFGVGDGGDEPPISRDEAPFWGRQAASAANSADYWRNQSH